MRITLHAVTAADYPAFHEAMEPTCGGRGSTTGASERRRFDRRHDGPRPGLWRSRRRPERTPMWSAGSRSGSASRSRGSGGRCASTGHSSTPRPGDRGRSGSADVVGARIQGGRATRQRRCASWSSGTRRIWARDDAGRRTVHDYATGSRSRKRWSTPRRAGPRWPRQPAAVRRPDGLIPPDDSPAPPRLLPMWDSTLLAYADRSRIVPPEYRKVVIRNNGDVLPTLLVDGSVAGVWRPVEGGIEATAFHAVRRGLGGPGDGGTRPRLIPRRSRPEGVPGTLRRSVGQASVRGPRSG